MHIKLDGTENWFTQFRRFILGFFTFIGFVLLLGMNVQTVQADGSVNLTDSGGDRPFLEYRNDLNAGILRRSTIYVYAQVGETIMLGSSAFGIGSGDINYVRPDGTTGSCSGGLIANRAQEVAGPGNPGGFTPCNVTVAAGQAGVWEIQFVSPNPTNTSNPTPIAATAAWTQPNNVGYVTAWDVTVRNAGGTRFPGRVYANYLALNMGGNSRALSSRVYVQTSDGYRYMVDLNNMDPFGFIFFSSPLGLVDTTSGTPLYHSVDLEGPNPGSLPADVTIDVSGAAAHKLFFQVPDYANLPASAAIAGGTTWLDVPTVTPPPPTNFAFTGSEGTPGAGGTSPLGGYFSFDTVLDGSFSIWLDLNQDNTFGNAIDRQLFGYASTGNNQIFWDGLDGLGAIVPASSQSYNAQIFLNAGEIHFPFIDVENNPTGFIIIRQVPATTPPDTSLLFWDDRTVTVDAGNVLPVPLYTLTGMPSSGGDHEFAGSFGDREAIENWTYLPTAPVLMTGGVTLQEADLEVIKSHSPANPAAGQPFSYSIVINNHGPSDSLGAIFTDTLPVEMLSPAWTCAVTVGTGSCSTASGTGSPINLTLDIPNGSQITVTVNGTLALNAGSPITNSASITRTDDTTDPNLVNNTDDDVFSLSAGFTVSKTADVATVTAAGNIIQYTITLTNTGTMSLTGVNLIDPMLGTLSCTPALPATLAPGGVLNCSGSHTVSQAEMDSGTALINTVTAETSEAADQTASDTVTITQTPALTIDKSVAETSFSQAGDILHYTYLVTNSGNVTLTGPFTVTDDHATVTCPATATLAPLASITCTATYTVTAGDVTAGFVTNFATAHGFFGAVIVDSPVDSASVPANTGVDLWLEKSASTLTPLFRGIVTFTITVHNDGPANATNVSVQDILPIGLSFISDNGGGSYSGNIWTVGSLAAGASASLQITASVETPLPVTNYAQVWTSDQVDPDSTPGDNSITQDDDAAVTLTPQFSRLIVDKTIIGGVADFVFTGTPSGTINVDGGILDIILPPGTYTTTETPVPGWTLTSIVCNDTNSTGNLGTGSATFVAEAFETVTCFFTNEYTGLPSFTIAKIADVTSVDSAGDVINYTVTLENTGNMVLNGVSVADPMLANLDCDGTIGAPYVTSGFTVAVGASLTCSGSYTVTQLDMDAGLDLVNVVTGDTNETASQTASETVTITQNPALSIVKTATPATYDSVGDIISYSYLVTNTGNVTLDGPFTVTDDRATVTCPATATLAPLGTIICTATYSINQADLDAGSVTNTAYASAEFNGAPVDSPTDSETVTADQNPALSIVKTAAPATYDSVGDIISYSYLVTNTGNVTLTGPFTVTDDRATVTCPATADLAPLASITCTATYSITQADLDTGSVINTAYASAEFNGAPVDSPTDSETVTADQNPALSIVKTATPVTYDSVGDIISYSYLVTNTGNVTLTGPFTVTDNRATATCPATADLAPLGTITCSATYTITQSDLDNGSLTNIAFASAEFNGSPVDSPTDSETVTADQNPALGIVKTAAPATYDSVGDIISYSYLVTNTGNVTLDGPFTVTDDRATVTCPATATLAPLGTITCTAAYTITQGDLDAGSVTNTAYASAEFNGAPVDSPTDSETVTADQNPALSIVKTATPAIYDSVGDIISYSYLVTNTGNVTLTGPFTVTDDRATVTCPATADLAPLASITCTATYTITQADLDSGSVTNTAYASAEFNGAPVDSPTDSETVTADQNPALALLKQISASATGPWSASITIPEGSPVYYRFEITNTGNVSLSPVWVTDPDVSTTGCTFADPLLPGQSTACVVGPLTALSGTVVNTAHASGGFGGTTYNSANSSAQYTGTSPDLSIIKSDAGVSVQPGEVISYSLDYQNSGTGAAAGVVITETVPVNTSFNPAASTAGWVCLPDGSAGSICTINLGTVTAGSNGSVTFAVQVNNPLPTGVTQVANSASIADDGSQGSDPTPGDNSDDETTPVDAAPDFTITKTTSINLVLPGDVIVYTLTYANVGNQDATGVVISETVPANTSFVSASSTAGWSCADGSPAGTACTFTIGSLAAGTGGSVQFAVQVALSIPAGVETIGNSASISDDGANGSDPNPGDNSDDESTPLDARPDLSITKTDGDGVGAPGGVVLYTLTITNNGTQAATGVVVTETVPQYTNFEAASSTAGWICAPDANPGSTCTFAIASISAGASRTLSFAVRIDAVLPAGVEQVANSTSVSDDGSNGQDPNPGDNSDSDDTPVDASPNLSVVKTDGVTQVTPGADLTYTLTISNHGGQDATGITIIDTLPEGLIFQSASDGGVYTSADRTIIWTLPGLAAGASVTRTITVLVDPALNGEITFLTNVAEVVDDGTNGEDPQPEDNTGEDTDLIGTAGKEIVAHSLPATELPDVAIGELLTYEVNLTVNPGEIANLVLTDVLDRGLAFVDCQVIAPAGLSAAPVALDQICSTAVVISTEPAGSSNPADTGRKMVATFGTVTNSTQQDLELAVRYQVVVLDNAENLRGVQLNNAAQWAWTGGSLELVAPHVEIVEPALSLSKTVNQPSALPGSLLTYTLTVTHTAESNSDAYNVTLVDVLPGNLALVPGTLALVSGQAPTLIDTTNPTRPTVTWDVFLNNGEPTVIRFQAILGDLLPGQSAVNTANVSWTSMPGDISAPQSPFNPLSYERYFNPGSSVDVYGATASVDVDYPSNLTLPETGFAPEVITQIGPMDVTYAALGSVWVEIPNLGIQLPIVGVPLTADGWDVQWLNEQVGWLQETAFPGFKGNSVITAHVYDADGSTGPFVDLHTLKYGTKIIVHAYGSVYTYEVRTVQRLRPTDMTPLRHENKAWLTLITCQGFDEDTYTYTSRVVVRAVLVSVK